jgi:hypothetical protein
LTHSLVTEASEPFDEYTERDALDGVEIHRGSFGDRVVYGFEHYLAG